jgi:hypothetical protein
LCGFCVYIYVKQKTQDMKTTMQETRKKRTYGSTGKKLFIILFSLSLAAGASAQRGGGHAYVGGGGFHGGYYGRAYYAPAYVGVGYGYGYGLGWGLGWGYPGWYGPWYGPYAYPPYYYGYVPMPSRLNEQINGIKSDYKQQIKDVKHDKSLPKTEREQRINQLEQQRDAAVTQARHDYYNNSMRNNNGRSQQPNNQQQNNNNPQSGPTNGSSSSDADQPEYSGKSANGSQQ